jgi:O-antigen/teichoic acid export membrane protein
VPRLVTNAAIAANRLRLLIEASTIQVVGSAATLLTQLALARTMGPEVQGQFSLIKAEIDFLVVFLLLGMPQSVFYFVQKGDLSSGRVSPLAWQHAAIAALAAAAWSVIRATMDPQTREGLLAETLIVLAVSGAVAYSVLRGAVLSVRSNRWFALFSAAPAVIVLSIVVGALILDRDWTRSAAFVAGAFLVAYLGCALGGEAPFRGQRTRSTLRTGLLTDMARFGLASWVPTICQSGLVLFALKWVERIDNTAATGALAAALALVAIATTPLNLVSPLLFKEWTLQERGRRRAEFIGSVALILVGAAAFSICVHYLGRPIVAGLFGAEYLPYVELFALVSLIVGPQALAKLWGVFCSASGRPWLSTVVDVLKVMLVLTGVYAAARTVREVALAWVVGEYAALALGGATLWWLRKRAGAAR